MTGIELIAAERERQVTAEGYDASHDDKHTGGEIAIAAAVYADAAGAIVRGASPEELHFRDEDEDGEYNGAYVGFDAGLSWPWDDASLKLSPDPVRDLVKAGALIAAEIDRLQRLPR